MNSTKSRRGRDLFESLRVLFIAVGWILRLLPPRFSRILLYGSRVSGSTFARAIRYLALRRLAHTCGELVDVHALCFLIAPERMDLGSRISVHPMCYIDATGGLTVGSDVSIAHGVSILTTEHLFAGPGVPIRDQGVELRSTVIGSDVWIGAGAKILSGVHIGSGSVVAAGSVVRKDVPAGTVVAGVPSRHLRNRYDSGPA